MSQLLCYRQNSVLRQTEVISYFNSVTTQTDAAHACLRILAGQLIFKHKSGRAVLFKKAQITPYLKDMADYWLDWVSPDCLCQFEFYCLPEDYTQKKYGMTKTHSEVIEAIQLISSGRVLDLGCGSGRNSLYLQKLGFDVTAVDHSAQAIAGLKNIAGQEKLAHFRAEEYNINCAELTGQYDWIFSTVVMMFLNRGRIPDIIHNMQAATQTGGYNLIVSAMSTKDYPCPLSFSFTFDSGELSAYYHHWKVLKYNENVGQLHKRDALGNRIRLRFVTLLAQKK